MALPRREVPKILLAKESEVLTPEAHLKNLKNADSLVRAASAASLSKFSGFKIVNGLVSILDDSNPHVRLQAILALKEVGHPVAIPSLTDVALNPYEEWKLREEAARAVNEMKKRSDQLAAIDKKRLINKS